MSKAEPLDELESNPTDGRAIALMLWKGRYTNPEMAIQITPDDIKSFDACIEYLEVTPEVRIHRPRGRPAQAAQPATAKRSAVPAQPAEPDKPYVLVQLVDKDGNSIKPIESTVEGAKIRDHHDAIRRAKDNAGQIADQLLGNLAQGTTSEDTIREAAKLLKTLAKA